MSDRNPSLDDAIDTALRPMLTALDVLAFISRHMYPPDLPEIVSAMGHADGPVRDAIAAVQTIAWPENLKLAAGLITKAATHCCEAFEGLRKAGANQNGMMEAYAAMRHAIKAQELLYILTPHLPRISRFFLEEGARADAALLARLQAGAGRPGAGILHAAGKDNGTRGGFSIYVPENYDAARKHPVMFALHGAGGNGRAFLWCWLRAARSHGAILVCPTSQGQTWALQGPDIDTPNLLALLDQVRERWNVDDEHMLLTGMSDGGSFIYMSALEAENPFTHLAPVAASFPPLMLEFYSAERMKGLPIHITHGALDWLFPAAQGRAMATALESSFGANVIYREIDDLSHTYPDDDENAEVMDWFLGAG